MAGHMFRSVRNLLIGLIDYAGLFPPAGLDMSTAIRNFEQYRAGEFSWALGRFIVPASRLTELHSPLPLSVLAGTNLGPDLSSIQAFHRLYPGSIDSIEIKVTTIEAYRKAVQQDSTGFPIFFEIPVATSPAPFIAEME